MANVSEKNFRETKKKLSPNSLAFREFCKKNEIDPLTGEKISGGLRNGYTVTNDLENGVPVKRKVGKRDVGSLPIYSAESAEKRVKMKAGWLASREAEAKKPKKKTPAKKTAKKPTAKKTAPKRRAVPKKK